MAANYKRKVDEKNWQFHEDWNYAILFCSTTENVICLLCDVIVFSAFLMQCRPCL